jgi:uncharacterized protein YjiK
MNIRIPFFLLILFSSCKPTIEYPLPFDFDHPLEIIKLPQSLHEISGITFYRKNELACVQDEKGIIYFYDIKKDKLRKNIPFAGSKDYEAITNVDDTLFVLCSNGEISEIDVSNENNYAHTYSTFLSKRNNSEGICYDKLAHRLLVACKGKPEKGTAARGMKVIYAFDLNKRELEENPVYVIDPDTVESHFVNEIESPVFEKIFSKKKTAGLFMFEPSEVGIDPLTNDVYVLSSVGKTILALTYDGKIKFAFHLNPEIFKQPEGISFSKDGSMFISDEGKGGKANLIKIKRNS